VLESRDCSLANSRSQVECFISEVSQHRSRNDLEMIHCLCCDSGSKDAADATKMAVERS